MTPEIKKFQRQMLSDGRLIKNMPWRGSWESAKFRCKPYHDYGKKGIKFCITPDEMDALWVRDKGHLMDRPCIDRIDSNGNYQFSNCQFVELRVNASNRMKGVRMTAINRRNRSDAMIKRLSKLENVLTNEKLREELTNGKTIWALANEYQYTLGALYRRIVADKILSIDEFKEENERLKKLLEKRTNALKNILNVKCTQLCNGEDKFSHYKIAGYAKAALTEPEEKK